jgi:hypothetical protein
MEDDSNVVIAEPGEGVSIEEYYEHFDELTDGGQVMILDLSLVVQKKLTPPEKVARKDYSGILRTLEEYYRTRPHPNITTKDDVLRQRVVAPNLGSGAVSSRSATSEPRAGRVYPEEIFEWVGFPEDVSKYQIKGELSNPGLLWSMFYKSLDRAISNSSNESQEQVRLIDNLNRTLFEAGIVHSIETTFEAGTVTGLVDFCVMKDERNVSIICESKSTHNLQLPITAQSCVEKYNGAYNEMRRNQGVRNTLWSNIDHPVGQLIRYLIDNKRRYGVLTSGTKTYFICAVNDNDDSQIWITDAWFVGQPNYLRAWAYVHSLGCSSQGKWDPPKNWFITTTKQRTPRALLSWTKFFGLGRRNHDPDSGNKKQSYETIHHDGNHGIGRRCHTYCCYPILQHKLLPHVDVDDIEIVNVIGYGRNGGCFLVNWNGQQVAMKQFDIDRCGDEHYTTEIRAYMSLRDAWGILVPRPIFLSESASGGRLFLGLQLGRQPNNEDDVSKFKDVLYRLKNEYGIQHNDALHGRNMIFIPDPTNHSGERIVAIDFEDCDFLFKKRKGIIW